MLIRVFSKLCGKHGRKVSHRPPHRWPNHIYPLPAPLTRGDAFPRGRIIDKLDYPFVDDSAVVASWQSVDFVSRIENFDPTAKRFQGDLYLKKMVFLANGKTAKPWWTWTKGLVFHSGDKTASEYLIKQIDGSAYMFLQWKSGDYTIRHRKPAYYVLKKVD